jgi:hypothetical protein
MLLVQCDVLQDLKAVEVVCGCQLETGTVGFVV